MTLLIAGADNPEHLALLLADELVEGEAWLAAVRGPHSLACGAFCSLGHDVVNVVHPDDPIVRVGEAGANPESRRAADTADVSPPGSGILKQRVLRSHGDGQAKGLELAAGAVDSEATA